MDCTVLEEAMRYRELGLATIPLAHQSKAPPDRFRWKPYQERLPEISELRGWFAANDFGLAIVCGRVSGNLIVRDFDDPESYKMFRVRYPTLCDRLPTVVTRRGAHVYARAVESLYRDFCDGELRGEGHYVVAPPSIHPSGDRYRWSIPLIELPTIEPAVFLTDFKEKKDRKPRNGHSQRPSNPPLPPLLCATSVAGEMPRTIAQAITATIPPRVGTRNHCLLKFARLIRGLLPDAAVADLEPHVREWHRLALPTIQTKGFTTTWREFRNAFRGIRRPGGGPTWADVEVVAGQTQPPSWAKRYRLPYQPLIRLVVALDHVHCGKRFPLACRQAAKFATTSYRTASRGLKRLVADGVLEVSSEKVVLRKRAYEYRVSDRYRTIAGAN